MDTCQTLIDQWHGKADGRINMSLAYPVHTPNQIALSAAESAEMKEQARAVRDMSKRHSLLFTQDGHSRGSVKFAHEELDILGPDALLSHSTGLTDEEIAICAETDTRISHNPSSNFSVTARCPVPELLDAGVTVCRGSDGTAPDRSYDMFRHMFHCMHYQRTHYHDANYIPPGKALEMVTIDSARALGMEDEIGSLEAGKKADVILVDMRKPHLYPMNMSVHRITYFANGNDVDTVVVNGKILMRNRQGPMHRRVRNPVRGSESHGQGIGAHRTSAHAGNPRRLLGAEQVPRVVKASAGGNQRGEEVSATNMGIIRVGNYGSSSAQGLVYYVDANDKLIRLTNPICAGYAVSDIKITSAFDVNETKIGNDLSRAIWSTPNYDS
jgi:hypothetical protein